MATCDLCKKVLATTGGNTSGAKKHLNKAHSIFEDTPLNELNPLFSVKTDYSSTNQSPKYTFLWLFQLEGKAKFQIETFHFPELATYIPRKTTGGRMTSYTWKYFEKVPNIIPEKAACQICNRHITYKSGQGKAQTKGMIHHLKSFHNIIG